MSEDNNVEIVRRGYEAFGRGEFGTLLELVVPDVVSYTAAPLPDAAEYQGREGLLAWIANWTGAFERFEMEVMEFIDRGDTVVVGTHQRGTGADSGVPVEQDFWFVHELRDGKMVRLGVHHSRADALEAAALPR